MKTTEINTLKKIKELVDELNIKEEVKKVLTTEASKDEITNQKECASLLENDSEFLRFQITSQNYDFIFLNGNTV
jgi:uncharacterized protein (UPF0371 family)